MDNESNTAVYPINAFKDNYIWLIAHQEKVIIVDPGDATPVLQHLAAHGLTPIAIFITHHHRDHIGGVAEILQHHDVPVYDHETQGPIHFEVLDLCFDVIATPGHTENHICFFESTQHWLFCGDTLFAGGCGRVFTKDYDAMFQSLTTLSQLPEATRIFSAHEYTLNNLTFAAVAFPDNQAIRERLQQVQQRRALGECTLPSQMALELATNPFLIALKAGVAKWQSLREWKDAFHPPRA